MKLLVKQEPRILALSSSSHSLTFCQVTKPSNGKAESPKVEVHIHPNTNITREHGFKPLFNRPIFGCLGVINVAGSIYLALTTGASTNVAKPLPYESVDKIYSVDFFSISSDEWDYVSLDSSGMSLQSGPADTDEYDSSSSRLVHPCAEYKKLLSNGSFYYSNDFDLTSLLQARGVNREKLTRDSDVDQNEHTSINVMHYQAQYMWNSFLMAELIKFRSNLDDVAVDILNRNRFFTTVIRGFAKTVRLSGTRGDTITIISKQSWKRAGTRYNARGIDDNGNVANFVETEFIFNNLSHGQVFAFTQIRGSVPAFWEQDSSLMNPKITITRSREATQLSFDKHFTEICKRYGVCHVVNLLSNTKVSETEISRRYTDLLRNSTHKDEVNYSHFDFHAETKQSSGGFAGATKILPLIRDSLEKFGWYDYDIKEDEVVMRQNGVFRVNCLDCLDRTNLIEQVICQTIVEQLVQDMTTTTSVRDRMRVEEFVSKHNALWADNGDAISQIYTGTNALKSSFSRSGKMNFAGALSDVTKSVSRMYQNTFVDSKKQTTIDTLLGKDGRLSIPVQIFDPISNFVSEKLEQTAASFTTHSDIAIFAGTYNLNAAAPAAYPELLNWLFPPENATFSSPDIYAIGLQELIELSAGSILASDNSKPAQWAKILHQVLNSQTEEYLLLRSESIASMSLFFFVKKSKLSHVTEVSGSSKKTGLGGMAANKGACAVRFSYGATSFVLLTSHFAAGVNAIVERHNDYVSVMQGLTFVRNLRINDHDVVLWFGDLNYRLNISSDECRRLVRSGAFDELQELDQLLLEKQKKGGAFHSFNESRILFHPTYKYDKGTSDYDSSEKQRVPSWTDRILYRSKKENELRNLNYNCFMDIFISDHKPVYSTFSCKVKFIDEMKKNELSYKYYSAYKADQGEFPEDGTHHSSVSESSSLASSVSSTFTSEALSELNLLDIDNVPPKLPARTRSTTTNMLPRRIPPPPASRKAVPTDSFAELKNASKKSLAQNLPDKSNGSQNGLSSVTSVTDTAQSSPPIPPSPRSTPNHLRSLVFNSAPLTPSNSGSQKSSAQSFASISSPALASPVVKPLKPQKPETLASSKVEEVVNKSSSDLTTNSQSSIVAKTSAKSDTLPPAPPPARGSSKTMADWKPLLPQ